MHEVLRIYDTPCWLSGRHLPGGELNHSPGAATRGHVHDAPQAELRPAVQASGQRCVRLADRRLHGQGEAGSRKTGGCLLPRATIKDCTDNGSLDRLPSYSSLKGGHIRLLATA